MYVQLWNQLSKPRLYHRKRAVDAVRVLANIFSRHGVVEPIHSAKYLVGFVIHGKPVLPGFIFAKQYLNFKQTKLLRKLYKKRLKRVPIQYLLGQWHFYKDDIVLKMQQPVFIPRPETEYLVDLALKSIQAHFKSPFHIKYDIFRVLEIGCGSGAISIATLKCLSKEQRKTVSWVAIDMNQKAVELTRENAHSLGVELSVLHDAVTETGVSTLNSAQFHLIISNPPYLSTAEIEQLQDEVKKYEDHCSLIAGTDGLDVICHILRYSQQSLEPRGKLLLEVSLPHPQIISNILSNGKYHPLRLGAIHQDFTGRDRFVEIVKEEW